MGRSRAAESRTRRPAVVPTRPFAWPDRTGLAFSDMTEHLTTDGQVYHAAVMDAYSR